MRMWRRKRKHPPREGWVTLVDAEGRAVGASMPVVVWGDPLTFTVTHDLSFAVATSTTVVAVRVTDADGRVCTVPLTAPNDPPQ